MIIKKIKFVIKSKYITLPKKKKMQDPYNYPFIQKGNTMYLSTISNIQ